MTNLDQIVRSPAHFSTLTFVDGVKRHTTEEVSVAFNVKLADLYWKHQGISGLFDADVLAAEVAGELIPVTSKNVETLFDMVFYQLNFVLAPLLSAESLDKFVVGFTSKEDIELIMKQVTDALNESVRNWQKQVKVVGVLAEGLRKDDSPEQKHKYDIQKAELNRIGDVMSIAHRREVVARTLRPLMTVYLDTDDHTEHNPVWVESVFSAFGHIMRYDRGFYHNSWNKLFKNSLANY